MFANKKNIILIVNNNKYNNNRHFGNNYYISPNIPRTVGTEFLDCKLALINLKITGIFSRGYRHLSLRNHNCSLARVLRKIVINSNIIHHKHRYVNFQWNTKSIVDREPLLYCSQGRMPIDLFTFNIHWYSMIQSTG